MSTRLRSMLSIASLLGAFGLAASLAPPADAQFPGVLEVQGALLPDSGDTGGGRERLANMA